MHHSTTIPRSCVPTGLLAASIPVLELLLLLAAAAEMGLLLLEGYHRQEFQRARLLLYLPYSFGCHNIPV